MSREPTWREVAFILADRLELVDHCDNGHRSIDEGLAVDCPCCRDRDAMRVFYRKSGTKPFVVEGESVPLHEIRNQQITEGSK